MKIRSFVVVHDNATPRTDVGQGDGIAGSIATRRPTPAYIVRAPPPLAGLSGGRLLPLNSRSSSRAPKQHRCQENGTEHTPQ